MEPLEFWAPCPRGLEALCGDELRSLHIGKVRPLRSGVSFTGTLQQGYRTCLWSRTASRVLLILGRIDAADADQLYAGVHDLPWEDHIDPDGTLAVDAGGMNDQLRNTQFTAVKVKDAICDRLRELAGRRPSVDGHQPDVRVNVALRGTRATISIDLAGEALHRRGYRAPGTGVATLRENLAAGMLLAAGWPALAADGACLLDSFCGGGSIAVEAAWMAADVAPGILRSRWGMVRWLGHDAQAWDDLVADADARAEAGRARLPQLHLSSPDATQVAATAATLRRALLGDIASPHLSPIVSLTAPDGPAGLVALNPPYEGTSTTRAQLPALYAQLGSRLRDGFAGWHLAMITPDPAASTGLGLQPERTLGFADGKHDTILGLYTLGGTGASSGIATDGTAHTDGRDADAGTTSGMDGDGAVDAGADREEDGDQGAHGADLRFADPHTTQFVDRLRKMYRQRRRWARKAGIGCYRIYDADLPDYAVAIDLYQGAGRDEGRRWVHVSEYAAPSEVDPTAAQRRLSDILTTIPEVLEVRPEDVFLKVRRRERGGSQYAGAGAGGTSVIGIVSEDYLQLEVNLSDYLDTGLFLDHRLTRELVFEKADRTRFLNLFAYTGSATVHAAAGGAFQTTTVDMSQTYLDWARRNMALNGFTGEEHGYVRADCLEWVREMRHSRFRWDLVFVDPPTFSTGAKMGERTWDVQRDHAEFLIDVSRLLTREGQAIFSCNLRSFRPDLEALAQAGVELEDITARTIPEDFARNPRIHHCYLMRRVR